LGTILGVIMNIVFPEYIIGLCLILLLGVIVWLSMKKGLELYRKEQQERMLKINEKLDGEPLLDPAKEMDTAFDSRVQVMLREDSRTVSLLKLICFFLIWAIFIVMVLLAGGDGSSIINLKCGSTPYIIIFILLGPYLSGTTLAIAYYLKKKTEARLAANYPFLAEDVIWTWPKLIKTPLLCSVGGCAAGFLGVGGGMVFGPIFLSMSMVPIVATTTASFMILFTSSSTTIQFIAFKKLNYEYALWYGSCGFISAIIGIFGLQKLIKMSGRQSYVTFILSGLVAASLIGFLVLDILEIVHKEQMSFSNPCAPSS